MEMIIELGAGQNLNTEIANESFEGAEILRNWEKSNASKFR
jgi:hypothetical protein